MQLLPLTAHHLDQVTVDADTHLDLLLGRLRWLVHTHYAHAICAVQHAEIIGILGGPVFGAGARITLFHTLRGHDRDALRVALFHTWLQQAMAQNVAAFTVTAPPADVPHWEALGFVAQENLIRYSGGRFLQASCDEVIHMEPYHRMAMMRLDKQATGEDRGTLLWEHNYLGQVYAEGNAVRGFALAMLGHGLIVADEPAVGLELQRWIFPTQEYILVPAGNASADAHLQERGYRAEIAGVRMCFIPLAGVRGAALPYRPELIYAEPFGAV